MADLATPSGAAMFDAGGPSEKKNTITKPEKPDEETYKANLKQAEKEHADVMNKLNAVRAKIDIAKPSSKDSPSSKRRGELIAQLKEIREKQGAGKSGRASTFERIKALDENLKSAIQAQKAARSKVNFKGVEDLDREIDRLDKQVNSGMMKLVDEKKALSEISNLRKQRKVFAGFDESQKVIDAKKADLKKLRDTLDDPESKALSEKYNKLQSELDAIKAEQDEAYQGINALHEERKKLQDQQQEKWTAQKKLKDDYYQAGRAIQKYEYEARQRLRERKKAEQETYVKEKKRARAQEMLADASEPAYLAEIRTAESIIRYYDPKYTNEKAPLQAPSQFSAYAARTVDEAGIKGMKVVQKKDEEDYFAGTGVMNDCSSMGIEPPMSSADVEPVVEKVRAKLEFYKSDQKAQTEKNIAKAKKELERLEAEDEAPAVPAKTVETNGAAHGETKATAGVDDGGSVANEINLMKAAGSDVIADLQGASLEDKEEEK
ncbi:Uncharacterized protein LSUB1_G004021 [Lachnellula subtilissima]|uniref:Nuclear segregation protein n=1 Tax=Lachnellula subtilissima TaxID=602034 RepID=A0A8H8U9S4_9HELO|nr:Uncharacterized protein LSUB1_G004021 [Lachnellula subtilissima]